MTKSQWIDNQNCWLWYIPWLCSGFRVSNLFVSSLFFLATAVKECSSFPLLPIFGHITVKALPKESSKWTGNPRIWTPWSFFILHARLFAIEESCFCANNWSLIRLVSTPRLLRSSFPFLQHEIEILSNPFTLWCPWLSQSFPPFLFL